MTYLLTSYEFTDAEGDTFNATVDHRYPVEPQIEYLKTVYDAVAVRSLGPLTAQPQKGSTT